MSQSERYIKCNGCGYVGQESEFPKDRDFFQHSFISGCPKCDNRQNPGDASFRMFGGQRPFVFVDRSPEPEATGATPPETLPTIMHRASEAS